MAQLDVGTLYMTVRADGSAAIFEIDRVADAASAAAAETERTAAGMMSGMTAAVRSGGENVSGETAKMISSVGRQAGNAQSQGHNIGSAISAGITAGMKSGAGEMLATIRRIMQNVVAQAKAVPQIKSPSRVMRDEVGKMLMEGITVGIKTGEQEAVRQIRQSVGNVVSGAVSVADEGASYRAAAYGGHEIDYGRMGSVMAEAVSGLELSLKVDGRMLARAQRENTARQENIRKHEINMGRGRVGQ